MGDTTIIASDGTKTDPFLKNLLSKYPQYFDLLLKNADSLNVQIIYTQINRDKNNIPSLTDYYFNVNSNKYFYPASTVKMPVALLALEKLNDLKVEGLSRQSTMITESAYSGQTSVYNDPTSKDGRPTIEQYIKKIFLVSDNDAYNRLYEFLGQEYINDKLHEKGYKDVQLLHRLQLPLSEEENRHTNPVKFYDTTGKLIYEKPALFNQQQYELRNTKLGKGYMSGDKLINEPFDFSKRNRFSLGDLHNILRSIIFPQTVAADKRFNLTEEDYRFLRKYMSLFPGEADYPQYPEFGEWDAYCKFVLYGSEKGNLPKHIRIFNKVGDAYGFLLDIAYVVDFEKKVEFFLSTVIYCNSDGIFNDDKYDYDEVGYPFMKHLGQVIYDYELQRPKVYLPDLSDFQMDYIQTINHKH
ncbi:MAG: serine hydrolase [Sphingobacteriales bacterium]|nr:serine hydrolase [Sphingobacteriales bacterium]MBI3718450.1 serine hydrolase [Sphingobacteriales bacterium]